MCLKDWINRINRNIYNYFSPFLFKQEYYNTVFIKLHISKSERVENVYTSNTIWTRQKSSLLGIKEFCLPTVVTNVSQQIIRAEIMKRQGNKQTGVR